ncbi:hypothetical protein ElyMa_004914600 [Elysia marginata]|uniref:Pecanex-like protein n=1 Tax=Elysia marginata TaxID=1093978 RepID=A0AAV4IYM8_9GAST|nr:hypothetical protein ElyMa_004914600 [Elysia marginata]
MTVDQPSIKAKGLPTTPQKHDESSPLTSQALQNALRRILWVLFCTAEPDEPNFDSVQQRWRLLLWTLLVSILWNATGRNWGVFAPILLLMSFIKVSVVCTRTNPWSRSSHCWQFPACLTLLCAISVISTTYGYSVLAHLAQKLAVREYNLWCHWCPDTHVTIASVIVITCAVQGVPHMPKFGFSRLLNWAGASQGNLQLQEPTAQRWNVLHKSRPNQKIFTDCDGITPSGKAV